MSEVQVVNPPGTEAVYKSWKFAQATVVGDVVQVAGQVGIGADGKTPESIEDQTRQAFENLKRVLEAAGSSMDHVTQLTQYFTDLSEARASDSVIDEFFTKYYPARTVVQVTSLVRPEFRLEVQATAVLKQ
jgi:enamine deaminase RidA (YjgF/YER057c/UK114 family)